MLGHSVVYGGKAAAEAETRPGMCQCYPDRLSRAGTERGKNLPSEHSRREWAAWMWFLLLALTGSFFALWFNRFAGVRSGTGEYFGGMALLHGRVPYRHYFDPGPPLNALKAALLLRVFGQALMVTRVAGVLERLLLTAMLFAWLSRLVPRPAALMAAAVTIVLSAGDRTDPLASYNHDAILLAMAGAMLLDLAFARFSDISVDPLRRSPRVLLLAFAGGISVGLSALTKHTVGVGCFVVLALWLGFVMGPGVAGGRWLTRRRSIAMCAYGAGFGAPIVFVALWLWRESALARCLQMILFQGPAAKASSPWEFVRRWGLVAFDNMGWLLLGTFLFALAFAPLVRSVRNPGTHDPKNTSGSDVGTTAWIVPAVAMGAALAVAGLLAFTRLPALHDQSKSAVYFMLPALFLIALSLLRTTNEDLRHPQQARLLLFAVTGGTVAVTLSLSWPCFEAMLLPGLALPVALVLSATRGRARAWIIALLVFSVFLQTREKLDLPFGFDYELEAPVRVANALSRQPQLCGLRLPPQTVAFLDGTASLIAARVRPGETVFIYPEMSLLYTLTETIPATISSSHNMDVVNDALARDEAARLLAAPPRVLVYYRETDEQMRDAERLWRHGRPSGQRYLVRAIEQLLPRYHLAATYVLSEGAPPIQVFVADTASPMSTGYPFQTVKPPVHPVTAGDL